MGQIHFQGAETTEVSFEYGAKARFLSSVAAFPTDKPSTIIAVAYSLERSRGRADERRSTDRAFIIPFACG